MINVLSSVLGSAPPISTANAAVMPGLNRSSERQPAHGRRPLEAEGSEQGAEQCTTEGQQSDRRPDGLAHRGGLHQAQALSGSGVMILLTTDKGFEIRHSIS